MIKYPKIETLFMRDENGSKKLIEGLYRDPAIEYLANLQWIGTEKIDGTNIGIVWDGHHVSFQGRTENACLPAKLVTKLNEVFGGTENEELFEQKFGENHVILFGEGYGAGIQSGGSYRQDVSFILFDVYHVGSNIWFTRDACEDVARTFGIDIVPIVAIGTIDQLVQYVKNKPNSTIGTAKMEGVVARPLVDMLDRRGRRIMAKIKVCDFC